MASDVLEESVECPPSREHYHLDWCVIHKHAHGGGASIRVSSDVPGFETQFVFADAYGVTSEGGKKVILGELEELSVYHVSSDG